MLKIIEIVPGESRRDNLPGSPLVEQLTVTTPIDEGVAGLDVRKPAGTVECRWFEDDAAALAAYGCKSLADLARGDPARLVTREHIVIPGPPTPFQAGGVKLMAFVKCRSDLSITECHRYWRNEHATLVKRTPRLRRYVQSHAVPDHYRDGHMPDSDGTAELWWDSLDDYRLSWNSKEIQIEQFQDVANFLGGGTYLFTAKETVLSGPPFSH